MLSWSVIEKAEIRRKVIIYHSLSNSVALAFLVCSHISGDVIPQYLYVSHESDFILGFYSKYALVHADKACNNAVIVWRLHYINT